MKKFDVPLPVKLVCGILYREEEHLNRGVADLQDRFGEIDFRSASLNFNYTEYYSKQMGEPLYRIFLSFSRLMDPSALLDVKLFTNQREEEYFRMHNRRVLNIDPGYLSGASFILATSKNYAHRIYLGNGVFAQQELLFERKRTVTLEWTYPDYRTLEYQEILRRIRQIYLKQVPQ